MAAANPLEILQADATCPICLDYYKDPVTTECGHNFCRPCISEAWGGAGTGLPCPQCREICNQESLRPNRQLLSTVEAVKQLTLQPVTPQEQNQEQEQRQEQRQEQKQEQNLCEKHDEKLKLFCKGDEKMICVVCSMSAAHKTHSMLPIEEAAVQYKGELQDWLQPLRKEMEHFLASKCKEEAEYKAMRDKLESERQKMVTEFEGLHELLKDTEQSLLRRLREMDENIAMAENANIAKLSGQISSLKALITEIEKKCEQPAGELLKDVRNTLSRCEDVTFQTPEGIRRKDKVRVTLDPDTAYRCLDLSEDGRHVTWTFTEQPRPDNPKRFTVSPCVLGREGFSSGRHYWELQLLREGYGWAVGVARESVSRKVKVTASPQGGVWAVARWSKGQYEALTSPPSSLLPSQRVLKLGLYLDYEEGRLSVYNAETGEEIYTFTGGAFTTTVYPYFHFEYKAELRLL